MHAGFSLAPEFRAFVIADAKFFLVAAPLELAFPKWRDRIGRRVPF